MSISWTNEASHPSTMASKGTTSLNPGVKRKRGIQSHPTVDNAAYIPQATPGRHLQERDGTLKHSQALSFYHNAINDHIPYTPQPEPAYTTQNPLATLAHACEDPRPCNNPKCEDVQPCTANLDPCLDPQQCLGDICYNANCVSDEAADFTCDEDCESATRCVTPCFGDECGVPLCEEPCLSGIATATNNGGIVHQPTGQDVLCQASKCNIPSIECVDPKCLSLDYVPAVHFHHDLDEFLKYGGQWGATQHQCGETCMNACQHQHYSTYGEQTQERTAQGTTTAGSLEAFSHPLQPVAEWTRSNVAYETSYHSTDTESWMGELRSLSATPSVNPSRRHRSLSSFSSAMPQANICMWTVGDGVDARPCGAYFENSTDLHNHLEKAHIDRLHRDFSAAPQEGYPCRWLGCSRSSSNGKPTAFAARPKLKRHAQIHTLHKPFTCPTCGTTMKTKDAMEKHVRTHSGERPYRCSVPGCKKLFATSTELKTHMVVHSGRKPHECPICGEGFADSSNLSKHKKTHYVGMYKCPEPSCGARMKRWDQMRRHIASQGHGKWLLEDAEAQNQYKAQMEQQWRELPDEEKLLGC